MKLIRMIIAVMVLIIIVGIFIAGALILFIDPNKIKPVIIDEIKKQTGYKVELQDRLSWTFYPIAGIQIKHMTITAPNQTTPFAVLNDVRIATKARDLLQGFKAWQGNVYITDATFMRVHFTAAQIGLSWVQKVLTLKPITASLYEGTFNGIAHGRNFAQLPKWDFNLQADNIQIAQLLNDTIGVNSKFKVAGIGQITITAMTQGKDRNQILNQLTGASVLNIKNGLIQGIDMNYLIQSADALINKQELPVSANINQTSFDSLTGTTNISNGLATTDNLLLMAPTFVARGKGTLNLFESKLQLQVEVQSQENIKTGWLIPMSVTGPVDNLDVRVNVHDVEKMLAKRELEKVKKQVQTEIEKRLPGATDLIQNFLGK